MLFLMAVGVALVMAALLLRLFFRSLPDLMEALFRPSSETLKLVVGVGLAVVIGFSAYYKLPKHFPKLARHLDPKATVATNDQSKAVVQARTNAVLLSNTVTVTTPAVATIHGVKLGDVVQISAIHPPIALRSATITSIDETQVTVIASSGSYTIPWKDLTGIKAAPAVKATP
jgi:hypothetical protein